MISQPADCETTLVVLAPQAEALVGPFRQLYDPSAAVGLPAHITINYPFQPPVVSADFDTQELVELFAAHSAFEFKLALIRTFPDVLYLAPEPESPFKELMEAIERRYPDSPPYGGVFDFVVPHLTVADVAQPADLPPIRRRFLATAEGKLPITAVVDRVWLMDNKEGRWRKREAFRLADRER